MLGRFRGLLAALAIVTLGASCGGSDSAPLTPGSIFASYVALLGARLPDINDEAGTDLELWPEVFSLLVAGYAGDVSDEIEGVSAARGDGLGGAGWEVSVIQLFLDHDDRDYDGVLVVGFRTTEGTTEAFLLSAGPIEASSMMEISLMIYVGDLNAPILDGEILVGNSGTFHLNNRDNLVETRDDCDFLTAATRGGLQIGQWTEDLEFNIETDLADPGASAGVKGDISFDYPAGKTWSEEITTPGYYAVDVCGD